MTDIKDLVAATSAVIDEMDRQVQLHDLDSHDVLLIADILGEHVRDVMMLRVFYR